jgi:hypothetical protein
VNEDGTCKDKDEVEECEFGRLPDGSCKVDCRYGFDSDTQVCKSKPKSGGLKGWEIFLIIFFIILFFVILFLIWWFCFRDKKEEEKKPQAVPQNTNPSTPRVNVSTISQNNHFLGPCGRERHQAPRLNSA